MTPNDPPAGGATADRQAGVDHLVQRARAVRARAYAPYSGFHVGAVVVTASGASFEGVNVENVSYRLTTCAEQTALAAMCAAGAREEVVAVAVAGDGDAPCTPCGACRQTIAEFGPRSIVHATGAQGPVHSSPISVLLPDAFTPARLAAGVDADPAPASVHQPADRSGSERIPAQPPAAGPQEA